MKKILSFFAFLLLTASLVSCGEEAPEEMVCQTKSLPEEAAAISVISMKDIVKYSLVRSENASDDLISSASDLYKSLREISTEIDFKDDYFREDLPAYAMGEYEILVGETNRPESAAFIDSLRTKDYGYVMEDNKIIIAGATDEYTVKAVSLFLRNIVNGDTSDGIFYSAEDDKVEMGSYPLDSLTIGKALDETPIQEFTIVYAENGDCSEQLCAEILSSSIAEVTGYVLDIVPDSAEKQEFEILVGKTTRSEEYPELADNESCIDTQWNTIQLSGSSSTALLNAVREMSDMIQPHSAKELSLTEDRT